MTFDELNLNKPLINALDDLGYKHPTTIQHKVFSVMMSGKDVAGIAQTGTGKTLAYLLPCLRLWSYTKNNYPSILIIVPTRELVVQVVEETKKLTTYMNVEVGGVYGGTNMKTHLQVVNKKLDILVATPGRLLDLALSGVLKLKSIKKLIIDEVDEMLNLGFRPQLARVFDLLPQKRQNLVFSATMTEDVKAVTKDIFNNPIYIEAAPTGTPLANIDQSAYHVPNFYTKCNLLKLVLADKETFKKVLVFTATKRLADQVFDEIDESFPETMGVIHANKSQNNRFNTVNKFQDGSYRILIATDIVARGLDISEVSHVFNFDIPEIPETYMHRIGRTGRADKKGIAISLITEKELLRQEKIEELMKQKVEIFPLPEELEISEELTPEEMPQMHVPNVRVKIPKRENVGPAFHEKKEKNKKVNRKVTRAEKMKKKYGKPKTRGQKKKR